MAGTDLGVIYDCETVIRSVLEFPHRFPELDENLLMQRRVQSQNALVPAIPDLENRRCVTFVAKDNFATLGKLSRELWSYQATSISENIVVALDVFDVFASFG